MKLTLYCVHFLFFLRLNLCLFNGIGTVAIDWKCLLVHFPSYRKLLRFTVLQLNLHRIPDQSEISNVILNQIILHFLGGIPEFVKDETFRSFIAMQWGVFSLHPGNKTMWRPSSLQQLPVYSSYQLTGTPAKTIAVPPAALQTGGGAMNDRFV